MNVWYMLVIIVKTITLKKLACLSSVMAMDVESGKILMIQ